LFKDIGKMDRAFDLLNGWMELNKNSSDMMKTEYLKLLIELDKKDEVVVQTKKLLENLNQSLTKHYCKQCGYNSDNIFWRCPQCHEWETIQFRWKV
jgi:lipopolysaccharide biosynthesis regulator YciM